MIAHPAGPSVVVPDGWASTRHGDCLAVTAPERDVWLGLVAGPASSGEDAVRRAWRSCRPGFVRVVEQTLLPPPEDGWEASVEVLYRTAASEQRTVLATARRWRGRWYTTLTDGAEAGLARRGAQLRVAQGSFQPVGLLGESFRGKRPNPLDATRLARLAEFIEAARQLAEVPGVAVSIVQRSRLVWERGFGLRQQGSPARVTPQTLLMIGSNTKTLTSLLLARLVDEGRFRWETPVTRLYPAFALADTAAAGRMAMQHTVCACSGMPRQDMEFLFEWAGETPTRRLASLRGMRPTTALGETFQYSNLMVTLGGYAAAHSVYPRLDLARGYERLLRERILDPLGMTRTTLDPRVARQGDHALPHGFTVALRYVPIPLSYEGALVSLGPAGALWSSAHEVSRYLMLELGQGELPGGRRVVSAAEILRRRRPMVKVSDRMAYGLALMVENDHGVTLVGHAGNTLGYTSEIFFLPEHDLGVAVLTNGVSANFLTRAIRRRILELVFDGRPTAEVSLRYTLAKLRAEVQREARRLTLRPTAEWRARFVGDYAHPTLGRIALRSEGDQLWLDAGEWRCRVARWVLGAEERLVFADPPLAGRYLVPEGQGRPGALVLFAGQLRYRFVPLPPARAPRQAPP